LHLHFHPISF
jgi:calcium/calmodulin-dependent protein kinase-4